METKTMQPKKAFNATQYKAAFNLANYDRLELKLKKGRKAGIQEHARSRGESMNAFLTRAVEDAIARDNNLIA